MTAKIEVVDQAQELSLEGVDFITSGKQFLIFALGEEHYGIDILAVKEIRGWEEPTIVPSSPVHVKGVTNLRGTIIPILDLRIQFQVGEPDYLPTTVVIVIGLSNKQVNRTMGFVVDAVSDVLNADENAVHSPPHYGGTVSPDYIEGLVNVGDNVVTLLKTEQLLTLEEDNA